MNHQEYTAAYGAGLADGGALAEESKPVGDEIGVMLLLYSEWLDTSSLMRTPRQAGDSRSHAELVRDFIARGAVERLTQHG